jgi:hypothetical protein
VLEAHVRSYLFEVLHREAAAIGRANQRAHTRASYRMNGTVFFFEDFQHTDVSDAARKAAAQRQADT